MAFTIRHLIDCLQLLCPTVKQVCSELRAWWDTFVALGQDFGYHPNAIKTHLIVKEQFFDKAKRLFEGTNVNITVQGKWHLGVAIGSKEYTEQYVGDHPLPNGMCTTLKTNQGSACPSCKGWWLGAG